VIRGLAVVVRALAWLVIWTFTLAAVLMAVLWGIGRVLTDTVPSLQQLHWIPTIAALAFTVLALALSTVRARSQSLRRWRGALWIIACLQGAVLLLQDWKPLSRPRTAAAVAQSRVPVRLAHVNANWSGADAVERARAYARCVKSEWGESGADVLLISEVGSLLSIEARGSLMADDCDTIFVGRFGIVSRIPVVRSLPIMDDGKIALSSVEFGAWKGNEPFSLLLVDLPSDPAVSRRNVLERMSVALRERLTDEPSVVVGDLNISRGSKSVSSVWPRHREAFAEQGRGWGATYPRQFPLWHIDFMLIGGHTQLLDYCVQDPGAGKHRMQYATMLFGEATVDR
jgi:hypothetical protein